MLYHQQGKTRQRHGPSVPEDWPFEMARKLLLKLFWTTRQLLLVIRVAGSRRAVALVHLLVAAQVGDDGEMTTTAVNIAGEWLLACVTVHVRL